MERYGGGAIEVRDYDPKWPVLFDEECQRLRGVFGPTVTIEHIGSTSVPGLAAKPIIDLLIGVRSLAEAKSACIEPLLALRYTYIPEYETWLPDGLFFRKGIPVPGPTTSMSWSRPIRAGRTICCFATICARTRRRQAPTGA